MHFLLTNSDTFRPVLLSTGLTGISTCWNQLLGFPRKELIIEDSLPIPLYISPLDEDWPLVWLVVAHFLCCKISSVPHAAKIFVA